VALEYDEGILPVLRANLAAYTNLELLHTDVRSYTPPSTPYKLVANIPYYLTSPILRKFLLESPVRPSKVVLLIQREVAEKICDDRLSVIALQARVYGTPELVCRVPRSSFSPPPKVESAVLAITAHAELAVPERELADFFRIVHAGFRAPRKKLAGSLAAGLPYPKAMTQAILAESGLDTEKRPAELSIAEWRTLLATARQVAKF
jgi:16S rRNA (adenine1518-N6/adenine1519-N6)-dimethyltransferase